ncbi:uncharacterized protein LOC107048576 [Diachasma alloeum]|uniref:uncharacterized protein LOC107048576 n=1 Tax=Diachasma alloeum TaxID=454923 RepID=UPI0007384CE2|nr:uncharacterized protein LOC107048576 [Diachasma alloeum]
MNLLFIFIVIPECVGLIASEEEGNFVAVGGNRRASVCKFGDYEYWMFKQRRTWPEAVLQCEKEGMEIAEVRTMDEAKRLAQIMMRNRPEAIESAWIGGYAKNKTRGITWRWISTNEEISQAILWRGPQKTIKKSSVRGCLLFDWHHWEEPAFIESPCDRRREYICQRMTNDAAAQTERPSGHQVTPTTSQTTTPSTVTTSPMTTKISSRMNIKFSSTSTKIADDDRNFTTVLPMTFIKRNRIQTTTVKLYYQERENEDYYNYDEMDDSSRSMTSTKTPLEPTTIKTTSSLVFSPEGEEEISVTSPVVFHAKPEPRKDAKPGKSLKLYYAFEGPIVGGLNVNENGGSDSRSRRKYQKYVAVKKKPFGSIPSQVRERIFWG